MRKDERERPPLPKFPSPAEDFSEEGVRLGLSQAVLLYRCVHSLIRSGVMTHFEDVILVSDPLASATHQTNNTKRLGAKAGGGGRGGGRRSFTLALGARMGAHPGPGPAPLGGPRAFQWARAMPTLSLCLVARSSLRAAEAGRRVHANCHLIRSYQ